MYYIFIILAMIQRTKLRILHGIGAVMSEEPSVVDEDDEDSKRECLETGGSG